MEKIGKETCQKWSFKPGGLSLGWSLKRGTTVCLDCSAVKQVINFLFPEILILITFGMQRRGFVSSKFFFCSIKA